MSAWDWGHKVAPLSKGMVLTARFGTWLEIGARAINWPLRGVQHAAGASLPGGGVVIVIDLTCEQVASAERGAELRKLCARPLFTSPMGVNRWLVYSIL